MLIERILCMIMIWFIFNFKNDNLIKQWKRKMKIYETKTKH